MNPTTVSFARRPLVSGAHPHRPAPVWQDDFSQSDLPSIPWKIPKKPPLYFWRDRTGHEVDLLVEQGSALYPIEIKSGQTVGSDAFTALTWWSRMAGQDLAKASLIYGGDRAYRRNKVAVRPWFAI